MNADTLRTDLRRFVSSNFLFDEHADLDDATSLLDSGLIDSTGVLELVTHLESTLGVTFDDRDLVAANFDSIDRMVAFVSRVTN
jgi:acyl carrier protein